MDNLELYNAISEVPQNAQKKITGGRLNGMKDINPQWRIKTLTERFGPAGIGWKTEITDKRIEPGVDGVMCAFVDINLYIKHDGEWSEAIAGTGGSAFVSKERNGLYTSDECFKMAYTDAISVACKALGMGSNVYWNTDNERIQTDDLMYHDIMAVQKRLQQTLSAKMKKTGLGTKDLAKRLDMTERDINVLLACCNKIKTLEDKLSKV